jgi:hypothetical protein
MGLSDGIKSEAKVDKNGVVNMLKWACIAFVALVVLVLGLKVYKVISAPAIVAEKAAEGVSEAVKTGTEVVKDSAAGVLNRLVIPATDQDRVNDLSESAFETLTSMDEAKPAGVKDRMFRRSNFGGHQGKVCTFDANFGDADVPVHLAADNEAYATAKALGANGDRLVRAVILVGDDNVSFNTSWAADEAKWVMKWKATTIKKPVRDDIAESRLLDILKTASEKC